MENQHNEELAIYSVEHDIVGLETPDEGFFTTYFASKENAEKFISENSFDTENGYKEYDNALFYDENENPEEPKKVTEDLIEMKRIAHNQNAMGRNGEFFHFEEKVDEKLIEHICNKYYSGYENCEKDQKFFKENKIDYDENGFIKGVQAINDNDWLDILSAKNIDSLDTLFKKEKQCI